MYSIVDLCECFSHTDWALAAGPLQIKPGLLGGQLWPADIASCCNAREGKQTDWTFRYLPNTIKKEAVCVQSGQLGYIVLLSV